MWNPREDIAVTSLDLFLGLHFYFLACFSQSIYFYFYIDFMSCDGESWRVYCNFNLIEPTVKLHYSIHLMTVDKDESHAVSQLEWAGSTGSRLHREQAPQVAGSTGSRLHREQAPQVAGSTGSRLHREQAPQGAGSTVSRLHR